MEPEQLSEGEPQARMRKWAACDRKNEVISEELTLAKKKKKKKKKSPKYVTLREFRELFHEAEWVKDKMLEAEPNLGSSLSVHWDTEMMLCIQGYKRMQALFKLCLKKYFNSHIDFPCTKY
jgi:hypothetical protein